MPSPVRFTEVRLLLERHGWVLGRIHGSHHIFKKPGELDLSIPVHRGKVKPFYAERVRRIVGEAADG